MRKIIIKNKKGFLLGEHTVNIIIAVIALMILIYLGFKLSGFLKGESELERAGAHMDKIMEKIEKLEAQGGGVDEYILYSPERWILAGFNPSITSAEPLACAGYENCICFCRLADSWKEQILEGKMFFLTSEDLADSCNELGICKPIKYSSFELKPKKHPGFFTRLINYYRSLRGKESPFYPMLVDDLIKEGKTLEINLQPNKLIITTK